MDAALPNLFAAPTLTRPSPAVACARQEGLQLMEAVLTKWPLMEKLKAFCTDKHAQPFSKDLWTQIGRFASMTQTGQIAADLANYDDDGAGGSAWPCAIDDFVEFVQAAAA